MQVKDRLTFSVMSLWGTAKSARFSWICLNQLTSTLASNGRVVTLIHLANDLLRGSNHAVRIADRETQPAIVVVDEILPAFLVLPIRCRRAADDVPSFLRMLQEIVDHDRRDRVLDRLQLELEIRANLEQLVEQERLRVGAPRAGAAGALAAELAVGSMAGAGASSRRPAAPRPAAGPRADSSQSKF